jgi:hypothetical protein
MEHEPREVGAMTRKHIIVAALLAAIPASFGCGMNAIPMVAVTGTTIAIPVPGTFNAGFGLVLNQKLDTTPPAAQIVAGDPFLEINYAASNLEDLQNGELVFSLFDDAGQFVSYLPAQYVTRAAVDGASRTGGGAGWRYSGGQVIAFVNIPDGFPAGCSTPPCQPPSGGAQYWIHVERYRRAATDHDVFEANPITTVTTNNPNAPWLGWGTTDPTKGIPIQILPGVGHQPTPFDTWGDDVGLYLSANPNPQDTDNLRPWARLGVAVFDPNSPVLPAAWTLQVHYPRHKVIIAGVDLMVNDRSGAVATWHAEGDTPYLCNPATGTLTISVADPRQLTRGVNIVYGVRAFALDYCGRAVASDFTIESGLAAYDVNGAPVPTAQASFTADSFR